MTGQHGQGDKGLVRAFRKGIIEPMVTLSYRRGSWAEGDGEVLRDRDLPGQKEGSSIKMQGSGSKGQGMGRRGEVPSRRPIHP